jgi:hypothetical protein
MQLFEDNKYPVLLYSGPNMPATTTLAFTQEELREKEAQGWLLRHVHREYPKHIPTGEVKVEISVWDGGKTETPVTQIVHDEKEEAALLAKLAKKQPVVDDVVAAKRGPGRPRVEETVTA